MVSWSCVLVLRTQIEPGQVMRVTLEGGGVPVGVGVGVSALLGLMCRAVVVLVVVCVVAVCSGGGGGRALPTKPLNHGPGRSTDPLASSTDRPLPGLAPPPQPPA